MRETESPLPEFRWTIRYPPTSHVLFVTFRISKATTCDGGVVLKINIFPNFTVFTVCRQIRIQRGRLKQLKELCKIFKLPPIVVQGPPIDIEMGTVT